MACTSLQACCQRCNTIVLLKFQGQPIMISISYLSLFLNPSLRSVSSAFASHTHFIVVRLQEKTQATQALLKRDNTSVAQDITQMLQ